MNKELMIDEIYEKIWGNEFIEDLYPTNWDWIFIWDVIDYIDKKDKHKILRDLSKMFENDVNIDYVLDEWKYKKLPLEEQTDECIEYIYNLIK